MWSYCRLCVYVWNRFKPIHYQNNCMPVFGVVCSNINCFAAIRTKLLKPAYFWLNNAIYGSNYFSIYKIAEASFEIQDVFTLKFAQCIFFRASHKRSWWNCLPGDCSLQMVHKKSFPVYLFRLPEYGGWNEYGCIMSCTFISTQSAGINACCESRIRIF